MTDKPATDRSAALEKAARERILVIDGAMGTAIQDRKLPPQFYAGKRFEDWPVDLVGNNDLLTLTQPGVIGSIHTAYLEAGADIIETNTFSSTDIGMADYEMGVLAYELNLEGAKLARSACDAWEAAHPGDIRWVAGAIGPTNRTASISPKVEDPGYRAVTFDDLAKAYGEAARGLLDGGADILLVETIFDTLNAKAALYAIEEVFEERGRRWPLMISGTITDLSGRTLSGQTTEAFWYSLRHVKPFSIGLNCALGAEQMRPFLAELSRVADTRVSVYPNAGLPNAFGGYDEKPNTTAGHLGGWAREGLVNIVGGCCGTTPAHIRAIAEAVRGISPRAIPKREPALRLSGLEPFELVQ